LFYLDSKNEEMCCGCKACEQVCPTDCISMIEDKKGFNYPFKNQEKCIECGLCEKVCPFVQKKKIDINFNGLPKAYYAANKNVDTLMASVSGGVFTSVIVTYCKEDFAIFGVQFDDRFKVIHSYSESIEEAKKYRKSKYVQSDINNSFKQAETFLKEGKKALFTGTPCQVAGLRLFLRKEYENLFCLDLVCHGVPSQNIFDKYIKYIEEKYKGKITDFTFRHKVLNKNGKWNSKNIKVKVNNKDIIHKPNEDLYLKGFHGELFYRPSCYNCQYANPDRISDITMADFWGVEKLIPEDDVHKGISVILVNTPKGQEVLKGLTETMNIKEVSLDFVIESNAQLNRPAKKHLKYEEFFKHINSERFDDVVNKCIPKPPLIKSIASRILPNEVKKVIKKIIKWRG
jgi:coenzyme F420-reducing hydrogenase beta subunit